MSVSLDEPAETSGPAGSGDSSTAPLRQRLLGAIPLPDLLLLLLAVGFCLFLLRDELRSLPYINDSAMHLQMVRWADQIIGAGKIPLDGWYPYLQLGSAHFPHYQSLPHIITAYAGQIFGPQEAFRWAIYLLFSAFPISIYLTARLFSLGRLAAISAAMVSPLLVSRPGLGFEMGSYVWQGYGVWSQLWGMLLVGPAMALSWRAVSGKGSLTAAAAMLAATVAMHFLTGYLAFAALAVWVVVRPSEFVKRFGRATAVAAGGLLAAAWVIYPLFRDSGFIARTVYNQGSNDLDSFGGPTIMGWLVSGELFDAGRFPVLTVLALLGLAFCISGADREPARCVIGLFLFSLVLYSGRATLGPLTRLIPGSEDLFFSRFISGVHLAGILAIGVAAAPVARWLGATIARFVSPPRFVVGPAVLLIAILALAPAIDERFRFVAQGQGWMDDQAAADSSDGADVDKLIGQAIEQGDGRIYAGTRANWGADYLVHFVPVYARIAYLMGDGVGFTSRTGGLSSDIEAIIDDSDPAHFDLLNAKYVIAPDDLPLAVQAREMARAGSHYLWELPSTGYLKVIETVGPAITANAANIQARNLEFLKSDLPSRGLHPTIAFNGRPAAEPTTSVGGSAGSAAGVVAKQFAHGVEGRYGGEVEMARGAVVMLKSSYDPRWTATVDGKQAETFMVAPSFVGVGVPSGTHRVEFRYQPYGGYPVLILVGLLAVVGLRTIERRGLKDPPRGGRRAESESRG
ncbi:MAG: YfhO family protein [Actinomycetota bacterium]